MSGSQLRYPDFQHERILYASPTEEKRAGHSTSLTHMYGNVSDTGLQDSLFLTNGVVGLSQVSEVKTSLTRK